MLARSDLKKNPRYNTFMGLKRTGFTDEDRALGKACLSYFVSKRPAKDLFAYLKDGEMVTFLSCECPDLSMAVGDLCREFGVICNTTETEQQPFHIEKYHEMMYFLCKLLEKEDHGVYRSVLDHQDELAEQQRLADAEKQRQWELDELRRRTIDSDILSSKDATDYVRSIPLFIKGIADSYKVKAAQIVEEEIRGVTQAVEAFRRGKDAVMARYETVRTGALTGALRASAIDTLHTELKASFRTLRQTLAQHDIRIATRLRCLKRDLHEDFIAKRQMADEDFASEIARFKPHEWPDGTPQKAELEEIREILMDASLKLHGTAMSYRDEVLGFISRQENSLHGGPLDRDFAQTEGEVRGVSEEMDREYGKCFASRYQSGYRDRNEYSNNSSGKPAESELEGFRKLLGVTKNSTCSEIRRQYKRLSLKYHPDKNPEDVKTYTELFQEISKAYEVLTGS